MDTFCLRHPTDTAHPPNIVPIYFTHSIAYPFCSKPDCWCQTNKVQVLQLLHSLITRDLVLATAGSFADEKDAHNG